MERNRGGVHKLKIYKRPQMTAVKKEHICVPQFRSEFLII